MTARLRCTRGESRNVRSLGKVNTDNLVFSRFSVVIGEPASQTPGFHSNNRVRPRVVTRRASKHLDADHRLLKRLGFTPRKCCFDQEAQEGTQAAGVGEAGASQNSLKGGAHLRCRDGRANFLRHE